jgi:hypothetical protein
LKVPNHEEMLKEMYSKLSLPLEPIISRWWTWLNPVKYVCENFEMLVSMFYSTLAVYIQKARKSLNIFYLFISLFYFNTGRRPKYRKIKFRYYK